MTLLASITFLTALAFIASEKILHRTVAAMTGAAIMVLAGVLDQEHALESIELSTIALLIGMMIIVHATTKTGVFEFVALKILHYTRGHTIALVAALMTFTAVTSAFLDNLTSVLIMVPILLAIAQRRDMDPIPLLVATIIASNIGGTATLVGDPPNIIIGAQTSLSFNDFIIHLAPISILVLVVVTLMISFGAQSRFKAGRPDLEVTDLVAELELAKGRELWVPLGILLLAVAGFFAHVQLGLEPATIAVVAATLLLVTHSDHVDDALASVDWTTLFFFAGLFVMVGGLEEVGVLEMVADRVEDWTAGDFDAQLLGIMWISAGASAFVDNIPFTAAMIPVVGQVSETGLTPPSGDEAGLWWSLALGACLGGNFTIIAAAANVAVQGAAEKQGLRISFGRFMLWGIPVTLVSLAICSVYVLMRYGSW